VHYLILPGLVEQEGTDFYRNTFRWQPKNLIPDPYRRRLLKDAQARFSRLEVAEDELQSLVKAPLYIKILRRMRLTVRDAKFAWRTDDLKFLGSIASFFIDYGIVLRNLKIEQARGQFNEPKA
jgi:hypothetical protein